MQQVAERIMAVLFYMVIALLPIFLFRVLRVAYMKRKGRETTVLHEAGVIIFTAFLGALASQTIIPFAAFSNPQGGMNLIPGKVFYNTYCQIFIEGRINEFLINFIGNIIIFTPIGFYIPLLWRGVSLKKTLLVGFFSSLFIEICQIWLPRETDVDDLWLNTLGALLGYLIYKILAGRFPKAEVKFKTAKTDFARIFD